MLGTAAVSDAVVSIGGGGKGLNDDARAIDRPAHMDDACDNSIIPTGGGGGELLPLLLLLGGGSKSSKWYSRLVTTMRSRSFNISLRVVAGVHWCGSGEPIV